MSIVGTPEWDAAVQEYIAAREAAEAAGGHGWRHADCSHGDGYCAEVPGNVFRGK